MYTADPVCYETTATGFRRWLLDLRCNAIAFDYLSPQVQSMACRIPLSQHFFIGNIMWVWTVVCMSQLYKAFRKSKGFILVTKTVDTMHILFDGEMEAEEGEQVIQQLTLPVEVLFSHDHLAENWHDIVPPVARKQVALRH